MGKMTGKMLHFKDGAVLETQKAEYYLVFSPWQCTLIFSPYATGTTEMSNREHRFMFRKQRVLPQHTCAGTHEQSDTHTQRKDKLAMTHIITLQTANILGAFGRTGIIGWEIPAQNSVACYFLSNGNCLRLSRSHCQYLPHCPLR